MDLPTRATGDSRQEGKDQNRNQKLENNNQSPVPLTQLGNIFSAGKVDPEADERSNRVEHLPESHDLTTDLWRSQFTNVDRARSCKNKLSVPVIETTGSTRLTQCDTLANTNNASTGKEAGKIVVRSEGLHKGGNND